MKIVRSSGKVNRHITFGEEICKFEAGDFTITETLHSSFLLLPRHDHELANLNFTINGSFRETIGRRPQECGPSSIVVKPAGEAHADKYGASGAHSLIIEVPSRLVNTHPQLSDLFESPGHIRNTFLARIAMKLYGECRATDEPSLLLIEGLILELLAHAARLDSNRLESSPEWLDNVRRILHERFTEPLSLSIVADQVGIHPSHLARSFRKRFGCSVGVYINSLRIEYAMRELLRADKPLSEIAGKAGFYDQSQFSNAFRRFLGVTPSKYRLAAQSCNAVPKKLQIAKTV
jgi:AraC family transcriptional regulator